MRATIGCIQDTLSSRARLDFRPSASREQRYLAYKTIGYLVYNAHRCPRDSHALIWSIVGSILPNHLNMYKTMLWGAILVPSGLLNSYMKFEQKVISQKQYDHIWAYVPNFIDFGP